MNRKTLKDIIENGKIEWQRHALERMLERGISREIVREVLLSGEIIEEYPDDRPYPSVLFLGWIKGKPFHVVAAFSHLSDYCFIVTAYEPDLEHFKPDYKTRR